MKMNQPTKNRFSIAERAQAQRSLVAARAERRAAIETKWLDKAELYRDAMKGEFDGFVNQRAQVPELNCRELYKWLHRVRNGEIKVAQDTIDKLDALGYHMSIGDEADVAKKAASETKWLDKAELYRDVMKEKGEFNGNVKKRAQVPEVSCQALYRWMWKVKNGEIEVAQDTIDKLVALGYKINVV